MSFRFGLNYRSRNELFISAVSKPQDSWNLQETIDFPMISMGVSCNSYQDIPGSIENRNTSPLGKTEILDYARLGPPRKWFLEPYQLQFEVHHAFFPDKATKKQCKSKKNIPKDSELQFHQVCELKHGVSSSSTMQATCKERKRAWLHHRSRHMNFM